MAQHPQFTDIIIPAITLLEKFKNDILKGGQIVKNEIDTLFDKNFSKYLDNQFDKFYNTKTFLFRDDKVKFYETFFPVQLVKGETTITSDNISFSLFDNCNYLTIIGNAGSGKTMLMKHLFLQSYTKFLRIPIVIELRHLNDYNGNVIDYIYKTLLENKILPSEKILERVLESGKFLFLFDGYDEIYSNHKKVITEQIEAFVDRYSNNFFVITSRPGAEAESLTRFENYHAEDLSDSQIHHFVTQQLNIVDELELSSRILKVIKRSDNKDYVTYLRNPLLLSMFILTFKQYPDLPRSKNKFYWNVFDTLVTKHDSLSKKGGFQHERKTGLQNEDIEKILKWFGYISLFRGKYSFDKQFFTETLKDIKSKLNLDFDIEQLISDLTVSVSLIIIDGLEYKFPHKSFQEYFCASLIRDLDLESKKKVYTEKLPKESIKAQSQSNFWNLCMELDKIYFIELFVLPILNTFLQKLKRNVTIEKFVKLTGFGFLFIYDKNRKSYLIGPSTAQNSIAIEILKFFESQIFWPLTDSELFEQHFGLNCLEKIFDEYKGGSFVIGDEEYVLTPTLEKLNQFEPEFNEKMNLSIKIREFTEKIKGIISTITDEVENEKKQNVSLLDI